VVCCQLTAFVCKLDPFGLEFSSSSSFRELKG
jgi:hypothetical protein